MKSVVACMAAFVLAAATAQEYPNRAIKIVVPWPPGQATDLAARLMAQHLGHALGHPVVIDNRPGAGGVIGSDVVAKAMPDGYTLLAGSSGPISINPLVQTVPYDPAHAFAPISLLGTVPYVLITRPSYPAANAHELIALLKANPGKYTFASSGTGATAHLVAELFNSMAGVQATHVPYKGSAPAMADIMNGQVDYAFETLAASVGHVKAGRLKAYGLSSARRNPAVPNLPSLAESADLPGFDITAWVGFLAPAGTPPAVLQRLSDEIQRGLQAPDLQERYRALGMEPSASTPDELAAYLKKEYVRYGAIVRKANIKLD